MMRCIFIKHIRFFFTQMFTGRWRPHGAIRQQFDLLQCGSVYSAEKQCMHSPGREQKARLVSLGVGRSSLSLQHFFFFFSQLLTLNCDPKKHQHAQKLVEKSHMCTLTHLLALTLHSFIYCQPRNKTILVVLFLGGGLEKR